MVTLYHSIDYRKLTRGLAGAAVLLGMLAGFLVVTASGAFAQTTTSEATASATNFNQAYALTTNDRLLCFDRDEPNNSNHSQSTSITGLQTGESLVGIDFRPLDSQLYGVSDQSNVYQIAITQDPRTCDNLAAVATQVSTLTNENNGKTITLKGKTGMDFNPANDTLRIVTSSNQNLRVNDVDTGSTTVQSDLNYASGDPNQGTDPKVTAAAYTNNSPTAVSGSTTLYDIDTGLDVLDTQEPAQDGTLNTQGPLGVNVKSINGFDIVTTTSGGVVTDKAYAALEPSTKDFSSLYTVDLSSGAVTKIGKIVDQRGRTVVVEGLAIPIGG